MEEDCSWRECVTQEAIVMCPLLWQTQQEPPGNFSYIRTSLEAEG